MIPETKSMDSAGSFVERNAYLVVIVFLIIAIVFGIFFFKLSPTNLGKTPQVSPHILLLTNSITVVSGKVVSVGDNSFDLLLQAQNPAAPPLMGTGASSTPQPSITYTVNITSSTRVTRMNVASAPPALPPASSVTSSLGIHDIKVNDLVSVQSAVDLRTLQADIFDATSITLPSTIRTLSGVIVGIGANTLTVRGDAKDYTVIVDGNTKISAPSTVLMSGVLAPGFKEIPFSGLAKNTQVNITFDSQISPVNGQIRALTINVFTSASTIAPPVLPLPASKK